MLLPMIMAPIPAPRMIPISVGAASMIGAIGPWCRI